jgi:Na+/H+ antiporter NhaC
MLIAERKTHVYGRIDGGDGKSKGSDVIEKENQPDSDTPQRIWNMIIPILLLVFLIIYLLIQSGVKPETEQSLIDMLQNSNSYEALLYATMATALLTLILFHFQFKEDESKILPPTPNVLKRYILSWFKKGDEPVVKPLMTVRESVDSFLFGMGHVFGATVILTFAWASGSIMGAIGTDRFFADWISDDINPGSLPTLSFLVSFIMALATGTSWGTMVCKIIRCKIILLS